MSARASLRSAAEFGYRVREARERQGITQAALAERVNVSIRWLSNFERGKSPRA
ncbi:helix-turn-helix transcriptional regulator [Leucobacter sp. G161]|uniref:helix-turn-helix domain-containing protein n=1 Tax=Leucobacter sp. G161 TaxID=663704 RepID=UPI0009F98042|nr:helix-turn-helix transcriptional regulator [Leucobacter sp. G161]